MIKTPYPICKGRKFRKDKLKKLIKPISCLKNSIIYNYSLSEKNKLKFITQLFRWFRKDFRHYKINYFLRKKYIISNCDIINLSVKIQKAGWKKLLLKLNYHLKDYKELKRRSYTLTFTFFFFNINNKKEKEVTIDINSSKYDKYKVFITVNGFFIEEFYNMLNVLGKKNYKKKDHNDYILEELDYVFSWNRFNKIISYDVYMPWFLKKEEYCTNRLYKRKIERKYNCFLKEKKFNSIFPLKNIRGHLIVTEKKNLLDLYNKSNFIYWKTIFHSDIFRRKYELFRVLKILLKRINDKYKINSNIVYFYIEYLK